MPALRLQTLSLPIAAVALLIGCGTTMAAKFSGGGAVTPAPPMLQSRRMVHAYGEFVGGTANGHCKVLGWTNENLHEAQKKAFTQAGFVPVEGVGSHGDLRAAFYGLPVEEADGTCFVHVGLRVFSAEGGAFDLGARYSMANTDRQRRLVRDLDGLVACGEEPPPSPATTAPDGALRLFQAWTDVRGESFDIDEMYRALVNKFTQCPKVASFLAGLDIRYPATFEAAQRPFTSEEMAQETAALDAELAQLKEANAEAAENDRRKAAAAEAQERADRESRKQTAQAITSTTQQVGDALTNAGRAPAPAPRAGPASTTTTKSAGGGVSATMRCYGTVRVSPEGEECSNYCECQSSLWTEAEVVRNGCIGGVCGAKNGSPCGPRAGRGERPVMCIPGQGNCQGHGNSTADRAKYLAETGTGKCVYGTFVDAAPPKF